MDATINLKVFFTKGEVLTITNATFEEAVKKMFENTTFESQPLKVVFPTTNKVLYFDKNAFYAFQSKEINQIELLEKTQCDALCRNKRVVETNSGQTIDPGTLFLQRKDCFILAEDDDYFETGHHRDLFEFI